MKIILYLQEESSFEIIELINIIRHSLLLHLNALDLNNPLLISIHRALSSCVYKLNNTEFDHLPFYKYTIYVYKKDEECLPINGHFQLLQLQSDT